MGFQESQTTYLTYKGVEAFSQVLIALRELKEQTHKNIFEVSPKVSEIKHILDSINNLLDQIDNSSISIEDKLYYKNLIGYQFNSKIRVAFKANESYKVSLFEQRKPGKAIKSGIPDELFEIVDRIATKIS